MTDRRLPTIIEAGLQAKIDELERINADLVDRVATLALQIMIMQGQVAMPEQPPVPAPVAEDPQVDD